MKPFAFRQEFEVTVPHVGEMSDTVRLVWKQAGKPLLVMSMNTFCPVVPLKSRWAFWPGVVIETEFAVPLAVMLAVTSVTVKTVIVTLPVEVPTGSTRTSYVPLLGSVRVSMKPLPFRQPLQSKELLVGDMSYTV